VVKRIKTLNIAEGSTGIVHKENLANRPFLFVKYQYVYTIQGITIRIKNTNRKHHHAKSNESTHPPPL
jgi:hypothetical protein